MFLRMTFSACESVPEGTELFRRYLENTINRIGTLYDFLVFSSLVLCFECVAMAYVSCFIQQVPWSPAIAVIAFFTAFSIYNLNRKTDEEEDEVNRQDRFAFTKRYESHLFYGSLLALAGALCLAATGGPLSVLATAAPFICGFLYSFRCLPERCGYHRLKEIPAMKNITVGFAWATLLALLPVYMNQGVVGSKTVVAFVLFFMWGIMASLLPDIRDRKGDERAGVCTIPVLFGEAGTRRILSVVLLFLGVPLVLYSAVYLPLSVTLLLVAVNIYSHLCVYLSDRPGLISFIADGASDGMYISFALGITAVTLFLAV